MCTEKKTQEKQSDLFFLKVKEDIISLCDKHKDIIEYQLLKKKFEKAASFKDLL